ncbi:hypothetical protein MSM1_20270 [Mycobacterium sp. SM1]|uniref:hypothetical protein n=1 Tax=Mycobacterium sp. SM1 TaxID=2816243 RepID=UPI001BCDAA70|nr:hypothetical protein [Mycobacterium sp. SM1]MBS4730555.1 hypothetical protein [Mycobacterium sp. SM1]
MHSLQASSPGTHGHPQMMQALVQVRQASWPSTRTGSSGTLLHMGQSPTIDGGQLPAPGWPTGPA